MRRVVAKFGHQLARLDESGSFKEVDGSEVAVAEMDGDILVTPPASPRSRPVGFYGAALRSHPLSLRLGAVMGEVFFDIPFSTPSPPNRKRDKSSLKQRFHRVGNALGLHKEIAVDSPQPSPASSSFSPHLQHHQPHSFSLVFGNVHASSGPVDEPFEGSKSKSSRWKFGESRTNVFEGSGQARSDSLQQETSTAAGGYQRRQGGGAMKRVRMG